MEIYEVYWHVPGGMSEDEESLGLFTNRERAEREQIEQIKNDNTGEPGWYDVRVLNVNTEEA
jgi:hypothetical protein